MKGDANDEAASDLLRCPARTGRALERQASHASAGAVEAARCVYGRPRR